MEKLRDYLLGSKFTIYTDNNSLAYVEKSKLGAAQIRWLSELALFDFDIKYRSGKLNQGADVWAIVPWQMMKFLATLKVTGTKLYHML